MELSNIPDKKCEVMVIKMLIRHGRREYALREDFSKKAENIKKNKSELKNKINEIKHIIRNQQHIK